MNQAAVSQELEGRQGCWWTFHVPQGVSQALSWLVRGEGAACDLGHGQMGVMAAEGSG